MSAPNICCCVSLVSLSVQTRIHRSCQRAALLTVGCVAGVEHEVLLPYVPHVGLGRTKAVAVHLSNPDAVALLGGGVAAVLVGLRCGGSTWQGKNKRQGRSQQAKATWSAAGVAWQAAAHGAAAALAPFYMCLLAWLRLSFTLDVTATLSQQRRAPPCQCA